MMDEDLAKMLKYIRLTGLLTNWDHYMALAQEKSFSHPGFLRYIIEQEYALKRENSRKLRLQRAKIPEHLVIETFPFHEQPNLNKNRIL